MRVILLLFPVIFKVDGSEPCRSGDECSARCEMWDTASDTIWSSTFYMCHGLIDYDFYVPAGVSQDDLSYLANTLGKGYDGALDNDCLRAIKKNICSKVYLPCGSDDIDFENYWTWNLVATGDPYTPVVPLPFKRPCKSTCQLVHDKCGDAGAFLGGSADPDCDELLDASGLVGVYSTSPAECGIDSSEFNMPMHNNFTSGGGSLEVANAVEPYIGSACASVVTLVYTAAHDPLGLSRPFFYLDTDYSGAYLYAPLLAPYILQSVSDFFLRNLWSAAEIGIFSRSDECVESSRMFVCSSIFQQPQFQTDLADALPDYLYVPQRASHDVCEQFVDKCQSHAFNPISLLALMLTGDNDLSAWEAYDHCRVTNEEFGFSWYPKEAEVFPTALGNVTRGPPTTVNVPAFEYFDQSLCGSIGGINHPFVDKKDLSSISKEMELWLDPATGMSDHFFKVAQSTEYNFLDPWANRVCPGGWAESNSDCPYSWEKHITSSQCFKSCYQIANNLDSMRDPEKLETINAWDVAILCVCLLLMSYMVATWSIFREKAKQKLVLVLSVLMLLQSAIDLLGYIIHPSSDDRYCENAAIPRHMGFNWCAVSAMLNLGLINPMFQVMIFFMALDVYFKICLNMKNMDNYWKYYTGAAFVAAFFFKFVPVFLYGEMAGFDGVNSCGFSFYTRQPRSIFSPTDVSYINTKFKLDLSELLLVNTLEHVAWFGSSLLFVRIMYAALNSLKRVGADEQSRLASAFKQLRLVKTPVLMIFFFSIVTSVSMYYWDIYAIENWKYFGPGEKAIGKYWNNPLLLTHLGQLDAGGPKLAYFIYETSSELVTFLNYNYKLIHHAGFPLLLFLVFGMHKDNVKLWRRKLGLRVFQKTSESSARGTSTYDWTIVHENQRLQKLGISKFFSPLFSNRRSDAGQAQSFREKVESVVDVPSSIRIQDKDGGPLELTEVAES